MVQIVDSSRLDEAKAGLSVITALHVYSLGPSALGDAEVLQNCDYVQTEELFARICGRAPDDAVDNPLLDNTLSSIRSCIDNQPIMGYCGKNAKPFVKDPRHSSPPEPAPRIDKPNTGGLQKSITADDGATAKAKAPSTTRKCERSPEKSKAKNPIENKRRAQCQTIDDSDGDEWEDSTPSQLNGKKVKKPQPKDFNETGNQHASEPLNESRQDTVQGSKVDTAGEDNVRPIPSQVQTGLPNPVIASSKRVMRTFYNDAGEEVTGRYSVWQLFLLCIIAELTSYHSLAYLSAEMVVMDTNGDGIPVSESQHGNAGPANVPENAHILASPHEKSGTGPTKKKTAATGKPGVSANPNQRSIASFFSKKLQTR